MKKKLLNSMRVLLVAAGLGVGATSAWAASYTEGSVVSAGSNYYLYNIGAGKFLDNGVEWNTRATVDNAGQALTLAAVDAENGVYTIYTGLKTNDAAGNGDYCTGAWMDNAEAVNLTFEALETNPTGYTGTVYKIKNAEGNYMVYNENPGWHDTGNHPTATGSAVDLVALSGTNNDYWLLIPKSVRDAAGDCTYLMKQASFNWSSSNAWTNTNATMFAGQSFNLLNEAFNTIFDVKQTITSISPGRYRVKVKGFYRNGNNYGTTDEVNSYLYATGISTVTQNLPLITTGTSATALYTNETEGSEWMSDVQKNGVYVPNSTNGASAHIAQGKYATTTVDVEVVNTLTIGVKCENNVESSWTVFDEFEIEYLGALTYEKSITYDFKAIATAKGSSTTLTNGAAQGEKNNSTVIYYPNEFAEEFGGKFAFQFRDGTGKNWSVTSGEGLYSWGTHDDYFSILNLKAGDAVSIAYEGTVYFSTTTANCVNGEGSTPAQWTAPTSGGIYTIKNDGKLDLQGKKTSTYSKISSITVYTNAVETVTTPFISSEATDGGRNVTITAGASSLSSGTKTYYTTDGSTPTATSTRYTGVFKLTETSTVKAVTISNSSAATASSVAEQEINLETVDEPTLTVTGADGNSRIINITCATDGATLYYSETEKSNTDEGWTTTTGTVTTSANTLWAYAEKNSLKSDVVSIATGAGTIIDLNAPTIVHSAAGKYTISNNQSEILGAPTATIHYQIDGGTEQTSTNTSVEVSIMSDGTLTYWLTADGYASTTPVNETVYAGVNYEFETTINFCTSSSNNWATYGETYGNGVAITTDDSNHTYYKYYDVATSETIGEGILAVTQNYTTNTGYWGWRVQQNNKGTAPYYTTEYVALLDLKAGQIVQIKCGSTPSIVSSNIAVVPAATYTGTNTYIVNTDGDAIVSLAKGNVMTYIYVSPSTVAATLGTNGYATFASPYPLDLTTANLPAGLTAYKAAVDGTTVTFTQLNQTVPANTGILLQGDASENYNIPVVSSGTAVTENAFLVNDGGTTFTGDANYYYFGLIKNSLTFGVFDPSSVAIPASKAYLKVQKNSIDESPSRALTVRFGDEATGINAVKSEEVKDNSLFNLSGQRVSQPTKGLYIVNGKKVIIK